MKKRSSRKKAKSGQEIPETNFTRGIRGKYAAALKNSGYTIRVYKSDGTFKERRVAGYSLVSLDPDVQEHFPDSAAVNRALRKLISPAKSKTKRASTSRQSL